MNILCRSKSLLGAVAAVGGAVTVRFTCAENENEQMLSFVVRHPGDHEGEVKRIAKPVPKEHEALIRDILVTATGEMTVRTMSTSRKPPAELVVAE